MAERDRHLSKKGLRVVIARNEQQPFDFEGFEAHLTTIKGTLPVGDYSLDGYGGRLVDGESQGKIVKVREPFGIAIERKQDLDELAQNLTSGRERFYREMLQIVRFRTRIIVVESGSEEMIKRGDYRSAIHPVAFMESIRSVQERYNIPIYFCNDRLTAQAVTFQALRRFAERAAKYGKARQVLYDMCKKPEDPANILAWDWSQHQARLTDMENTTTDLVHAWRVKSGDIPEEEQGDVRAGS